MQQTDVEAYAHSDINQNNADHLGVNVQRATGNTCKANADWWQGCTVEDSCLTADSGPNTPSSGKSVQKQLAQMQRPLALIVYVPLHRSAAQASTTLMLQYRTPDLSDATVTRHRTRNTKCTSAHTSTKSFLQV